MRITRKVLQKKGYTSFVFLGKKIWIKNKDKEIILPKIKELIKKKKTYKHRLYYKKRTPPINTDRFRIRLDNNISSLISRSLKGKKAGRRWESLVGYTLEDLIIHLEKQFDNKMNWENYGGYWWIDHIKPRSLFKYKTAEDPEFKKCWALKNLQPMEKFTNIKKRNYY